MIKAVTPEEAKFNREKYLEEERNRKRNDVFSTINNSLNMGYREIIFKKHYTDITGYYLSENEGIVADIFKEYGKHWDVQYIPYEEKIKWGPLPEMVKHFKFIFREL